MAEPQAPLSLRAPFLIPLGVQTFRCVLPSQRYLFCASRIGWKIHQTRCHTVYSNLELHSSQVPVAILQTTAQAGYLGHPHSHTTHGAGAVCVAPPSCLQ